MPKKPKYKSGRTEVLKNHPKKDDFTFYPKTLDQNDGYAAILAMLGKLADQAEDTTLGQHARDHVQVLRQRVETLSTALRVTIIALSCYGQPKETQAKFAEEISKLLHAKDAWDSDEENI